MRELPREETERRWRITTPQWPIMHAVTYGVTRDQMMARHKANHIQVAYAPDADAANRALAAKAAMFRELGLEVNICGTKTVSYNGKLRDQRAILMRVGIIGTGAISHKHAQAYANIGYELTVCTDINAESGRAFARAVRLRVRSDLRRGLPASRRGLRGCLHVPRFPAATAGDLRRDRSKHIQVQKPIATNLETAREMIEMARDAPASCWAWSASTASTIPSSFCKRAIDGGPARQDPAGRRYVKWYRIGRLLFAADQRKLGHRRRRRADQPGDPSGGHSAVARRAGFGSVRLLAARRAAQDRIGRRGQRAAAICDPARRASFRPQRHSGPGYTERIEIHGTKGTAIISGDKLTTWDVENDSGEPAPVDRDVASGASDPMAISLAPFERQFLDFGEAIRTGRKPVSSGEDGYRALEVVDVGLSNRAGGELR